MSGILFTTICLMSVCSNIVERISRSNRFSRGYRNAPFVTRYSSDADDVMIDRETSQLQDKRRKIESFHFLSNRISLGSKKNLDREINRRRTEIALKMKSCCRSLAKRGKLSAKIRRQKQRIES